MVLELALALWVFGVRGPGVLEVGSARGLSPLRVERVPPLEYCAVAVSIVPSELVPIDWRVLQHHIFSDALRTPQLELLDEPPHYFDFRSGCHGRRLPGLGDGFS